jgi:hypothetical protein
MSSCRDDTMKIMLVALGHSFDWGEPLTVTRVHMAYEDWACADIRTGIDSMERDEYRARVRYSLRVLGFDW